MTNTTTAAAELGTEIGRELLEDHYAKDAPRSAAADLIRTVLEVNPRAKLPALLTKVRVRDWMTETRVTETMLREALAVERKRLRDAKPKPALALPPKRQRTSTEKVAATPQIPLMGQQGAATGPAPDAGLFDDGIVPN